MRIAGTGVELRLSEEPFDYGRPTPEQRAEAQRVAGGEMVEVRAVLFAEDEDGGRVEQNADGARIDLATDPTSALIALARAARQEDDLLGDFRDEGVSRFQYHAAPHRIELSDGLCERLRSAGWTL